MVKILVIGDLHGRMPNIYFKEFDCIVCVGDVCDDRDFLSYIHKWFKLIIEDTKTNVDYRDLIIEDVGEKGLKKFEENSLKKGRKVLEYLDSFGKPVFFIPGNWDQSYGETRIKDSEKNSYNKIKFWIDLWSGKKTNSFLIKGLKNVRDCQDKTFDFSGLNFLGYGLCNAPEEFIERAKKQKLSKDKFRIIEKSSYKLYNWIVEKYKNRNKKFPVIFLSHNVPHNTKLDLILNKKSPRYKTHAGSKFARKFCLKYNPLLCIGGHMHEHFGKDKLGKTVVVNAGYGKDAQVLIDVDEKRGKVRKIKFNPLYK
jgi:Icc-related predicted phosphoesterase